jgi:hypothetical protein
MPCAMVDPALRFYRKQWQRYLLPSLIVLVLDFLLLFVLGELPWPKVVVAITLVRAPLVGVLSGWLGGFVRFLVAEPVSVENLHDTANMFRYWASLIVGAVLGLFSYLLLLDARLLKLVFPTVSLPPDLLPSAASAAIFGGLFGLLAREIIIAGQKRFSSGGSKHENSGSQPK